MVDFQFKAKDKPNAQDLNNEAVRLNRYSREVSKKVSEAITALPNDAVEISVAVTGEDIRASYVEEDGSRKDGKSYDVKREDMPAGDRGSVSVTSKPGLVPTSAVVGTNEGLIREDTHGDLGKGFDVRTRLDKPNAAGAPSGDIGYQGVRYGRGPGELERRVPPPRGPQARVGPDDGRRRVGERQSP